MTLASFHVLLTIYVSSLEKCLFLFLARFHIGFLVLVWLRGESSLYSWLPLPHQEKGPGTPGQGAGPLASLSSVLLVPSLSAASGDTPPASSGLSPLPDPLTPRRASPSQGCRRLRPPARARAQQLAFIARKRENAAPFRATTCSTLGHRHTHGCGRSAASDGPQGRAPGFPSHGQMGRQGWRDVGGGAQACAVGGPPARATAAPSGQALPRPAYLNFPELSTACKLRSHNFENQGTW